MVQLRQQLALELMREADVNTVQEIEREIFATPWPRNAYYRELASRGSAHYVVLRQEGQVDRPVGYRIADRRKRVPAFDPGPPIKESGKFHTVTQGRWRRRIDTLSSQRRFRLRTGQRTGREADPTRGSFVDRW